MDQQFEGQNFSGQQNVGFSPSNLSIGLHFLNNDHHTFQPNHLFPTNHTNWSWIMSTSPCLNLNPYSHSHSYSYNSNPPPISLSITIPYWSFTPNSLPHPQTAYSPFSPIYYYCAGTVISHFPNELAGPMGMSRLAVFLPMGQSHVGPIGSLPTRPMGQSHARFIGPLPTRPMGQSHAEPIGPLPTTPTGQSRAREMGLPPNQASEAAQVPNFLCSDDEDEQLESFKGLMPKFMV
ncbi:hypothetical protein CsatA_022027 [Cannabis sativa]